MASIFKCDCFAGLLNIPQHSSAVKDVDDSDLQCAGLPKTGKSKRADSRADSDVADDDADELNLVPLPITEEKEQQLLRKLALDLESINENRSADDKDLLTKLVAQHEEVHGKLLSQPMKNLPDLEEFSDKNFRELPLPEVDTASLLDGTTTSLLVQHLQQCPDVPLHPKFLAQLLDSTRRLHDRRSDQFGPVMSVNLPQVNLPAGERPAVRRSESPQEGARIVVLGDTHGQLADVLWAMSKCGMPSDHNLYIFNGDIADRSYHATEIFALLFTIMLQYRNTNVVLLNRGNHECLTLNGSRCGGFRDELLLKYGHEVGAWLHERFGDVFAALPLATVLNDAVLCIHGGLGTSPETHLDQLRGLGWDVREPTINGWGIRGDPQIDALEDAVWSDPGDEPGSIENPRGHGHIWGPDYTERFLKATGLQLIVRSHQVPKDHSGVFTHEAHGGHVLTLFTASNYMSMGNRGGALIFSSSGTDLEYCIIDLGLCPNWSAIQKLPLVEAAEGEEQYLPRQVSVQSSGDQAKRRLPITCTLREALLQEVMGFFVEFRVSLWEACTAQDRELTGQVGMQTWVSICKKTTDMSEVDWILVARLLGQCTANHVQYMELLNRFSFHIGSDVVDQSLAEGILADIFNKMMTADESLQQLLGEVCHGTSRKMPAQDLLASFRELLLRNGISAAGVSLVVRSLESHTASSPQASVDVAEFLSAWKCGAGIRADLEISPSQRNLATSIARLLTAPKTSDDNEGGQVRQRRLSSFAVASGGQLMDFFTAADVAGDGFMSLEEGMAALKELIRSHRWQVDEAGVRGLLEAADVTGRGSLNYLEFIRIFEFHDTKNLTNQHVLDALCLRIWLHRNALSALYRHIGKGGFISQEQVSWSLRALNRIVDGKLDEEHISSLVSAVTFVDGSIAAETFLRSFDIFDSHK